MPTNATLIVVVILSFGVDFVLDNHVVNVIDEKRSILVVCLYVFSYYILCMHAVDNPLFVFTYLSAFLLCMNLISIYFLVQIVSVMFCLCLHFFSHKLYAILLLLLSYFLQRLDLSSIVYSFCE